MAVTIGSHVVGMAAVFFQIVYLFAIVMVLNITNGIVVFVFHTSMDVPYGFCASTSGAM